MNRNLTCRRGFTLLEIIVTLTILSVLGVMVYQFMGSSLIRSVEPFSTLAKTFVLREVAENITADYLQSIPRNVPALKANIGAEGSAHINEGIVLRRAIADIPLWIITTSPLMRIARKSRPRRQSY